MSITRISGLALLILLLSGCSDPKPDGHVYTTNGLGITLPMPDVEMAFLPYNSRAEFFHDPISQAYRYATLGLEEALLPLCDEADAIVEEQLTWLAQARSELQQKGNVPETPDACMNICSSRVSLEDQRETEREALNQKITGIDQKISSAKEKKKQLQSARSKKAGTLSQQLVTLKEERNQLLDTRALELAAKQVKNLSIVVGARGKGGYGRTGEKISVDLQNNSEFAIQQKAGYGQHEIQAEGYHQGIKIADYKLYVPGYGVSNKVDSLGFDKGYLALPGKTIELGRGSIYNNVEGLSLNTPSGRLLAQDRGWEPNSRGYVLPDEIRIVSFPESAFVIPDEEGKRVGSRIEYSPEIVNFKEQVADRGLPQDREIAALSRRINNQSFAEDDQIAAQDKEISRLRADQQSARDAFNSSQVAQDISALLASESLCRAAGDAMNEINTEAARVANWKDNLSSCGTAEVDTGAIFFGINAINYTYGSGLELPEIEEKYAAKARQLIWAKLATESQHITKTDINGGFNIDDAVDQSNSLVFANTLDSSDFWMQPLSSLKGKKNLNHKLLNNQHLTGYIEDVIGYPCRNCSLEGYSSMMVESGLSAPNPNQLVNALSDSERFFAEQLADLEASELDERISEEPRVKAAPAQACNI